MYAFGPFQVDTRAHELRRSGVRIKIQDQPFLILVKLLERPGQLVTREELRSALWNGDTFVDFDTGLNTAVKRLREALGDSAESPVFVETLPKLGYRFVAPVQVLSRGFLSGSAQREKNAFRYTIPGALVLLAAGLTLAASIARRSDGLKVSSFLQLTNDGRQKQGAALRTDGARIYMTEFESDMLVAQVSVKGGETTPLTVALREPRQLDLSKDGTELLLLEGESFGPPSLWIQSVVGGAPQRVGDLIVDTASWGPNQETITYTKGHDIYVARRDGSLSRKLLTAPGIPSSLRFSPDGKQLRFTLADDQDQTTTLWEVSADGSNLHPLLHEWNTPASECCGSWTADGRYFVFQSTQNNRTDIWAIREKTGLLKARSRKPEQLTSGPMNFFDPISSRDGGELFAVGVLPRAEVVRYDLRTHWFIPFLSGISAEGLDFSRDGNWVTYTSYPEGTLWRSRIDGSERLQLTFPPMRVLLPRWSPDGKQIAFMGSPPSGPWKLGGPWKIYLTSFDGGTPQQLLPGERDESDPTWSADGNSIAFGRLPQPGNAGVNPSAMNVEVLELKSRKLSTLPGSDGLYSPRWSPDGRYIVAFTPPPPNRPRLFDWTTGKWTPLAETEMGYPSWSRDSKYIYMQDWNDGHPRIVRVGLRDRRIESIVYFSEVWSAMVGTIAPWSGVAPDGSPLVARDVSSQEIYALKLHAQ